MTVKQVEEVLEFCKENGLKAETHEGYYSGSDMWGASTFAVVISEVKSDCKKVSSHFKLRLCNYSYSFIVY